MTHVTPVQVQTNFRLRNDDGSETTATWLAALNTSATIDTGLTFRARFEVDETAGGSATLTPTLYYSLNGGAYAAVSTSTPIQAVASGNVSDAAATTQQIGAGTFVAGFIDSNAAVGSVSISNSGTEIEYVLQIDAAQVADADTIALRVYNSGAVLNTYLQTPTVTVNEAVPDALLADDIQSTSETGSAAIGQAHVFAGDDVQSTSSVTSAALGQVHAISADDLQSTSEVTAAALALITPLLADDIEAASETGSAAIGQVHVFAGDDVQATSETGSAAFGQAHALTGTGVQATSEAGTAAIGQVHVLTWDDTEAASEVGSAALGQVHGLAADDTEAASEVTAATLGGAIPDNAILDEDGLALLDENGDPILDESSVFDVLTATSIEAASEVAAAALGQVHVLAADDLAAASEVTAVNLGQVHGLAADDIEAASEVDPAALTGAHALTATSIEAASEVAGSALVEVEGVSPELIFDHILPGLWQRPTLAGAWQSPSIVGTWEAPVAPAFGFLLDEDAAPILDALGQGVTDQDSDGAELSIDAFIAGTWRAPVLAGTWQTPTITGAWE